MHIEKIKLNKFRVLQNMEVEFLVPPAEANEHGNTINVVAGVNGTGKTSLLEAIYLCFEKPDDFININKLGNIDIAQLSDTSLTSSKDSQINKYLDRTKIQKYIKSLHTEGANSTNISQVSRLIFLTSQLSFNYQVVPQLSVKYQVCMRVNNDSILGNAEFYIKEFILSHERKSRTADPEQRTNEAITLFNDKFLDTELLTKLEGLDPQQFNRPIFTNAAGEKVTIDQLSDGEKQLYGRVISLMILDPHNSVILIDEPEIALHPSWQQQIMSVYSKIGKNNQFIVATHSPQIIASTNYENLIILTKQDGKISALYPSSPPSGVDVNSILEEVMGVKNTLPKDVDDLQRAYRQLVKNKQEDSEEALAVKAQLLERESNDSKFMQEMRLLIRLRGSK